MELDWSKLSRDYRSYPLTKIEQPNYDDLFYLYIDANLSQDEVIKIMGSPRVIVWLHKYNIKKTKEQKTDCRRRTCLQRYGQNNVSKCVQVKQKKINTSLNHYGVDNPAESKVIQDRIKQTLRKKYGVDNPMKLKEIQEKMKSTMQNRYGETSPGKVKQFQEKKINTMLKKYGKKNPAQVKEFQEKTKQTNLERYDSEYLYGSTYFKSKVKQTWMKNYGEDNPMKVPAIKQKIIDHVSETKRKEYETKAQNNSYNRSEPEKRLFKLLLTKFKNAKNPYRCDRYPYACDYYIPELDVFIELHFFWTHGKEPFDSKNEKHQKILEKWKEKAKTSKFFKIAIYEWTELDVRKYEIARRNNLNYYAFYTENQFMQWFNSLGDRHD